MIEATAPAPWVPFVDPLPLAYDWWWLAALPLALGISMIYKGYRMETLAGYWRAVAIMAGQIVAAMAAFAVSLAVILIWILPLLPAE